MEGNDSLAQICQRAAQAALARHGWCLLDATTLAGRAASLLAATPACTPAQAERACRQVYAQTLHAAAQDQTRQAAAYRELHAYLYRIAQHQRPDLAEDAAQEAVLLLFQNIRTCREPSAFLKFAIYQLLTAFHRLAPHAAESSLDELMEGQGEGGAPLEFPAGGAGMEDEVEERAQAAELLRWLRATVASNPRARNQILAVAMKYLEEWDDARIAAALHTTVANVHVLRSRGLEKLRAEYEKHGAAARNAPLSHPGTLEV